MKKILIPFLISSVLIITVFLFFESLETYFTELLKKISEHKTTYSFVSFIVLASDIILPVPSSIVMYTNGFVLGLFGGTFVSFFSVMTGAIAGYYLGKWTSIVLKANDDEKANSILSR